MTAPQDKTSNLLVPLTTDQEDTGVSEQGKREPSWLWGALAGLVAGAFMAGAYWPLNAHWLAWVAMVPLLVLLPSISSERAWLYGTLAGLVFYRIGLAWLFGISGPLASFAIVVLAIWMGFTFRIARLLMDRFGLRAMLWAMPLAFVGQEVLRAEGLPRLRFGFLVLGYTQAHHLWIAQIASLGGVYAVSLLVVASNSAAAWAVIGLWDRRVSGKRNVYKVFVPVVALFGLVSLLGIVSQPRGWGRGPEIPVACVQGETCGYKQFEELTAQALRSTLKPKLVVLPEHTITDMATERNVLRRALANLAVRNGAYVCIGAHMPAAQGSPCSYDNVGLMIGPDGQAVGTQAKVVPVPFFEDGNPARTQSLLQTAYGPVGVAMCYDATFTDVPRRLVAMGAEILVVPVMDPMQWPVQERWQHADIALFRSIELRRWQLRAASSGISQIIDPAGRVRELRTLSDGDGYIADLATLERDHTVYSSWGHLIPTAIGLLFLLLTVALTVADWRKRWVVHRKSRLACVSP